MRRPPQPTRSKRRSKRVATRLSQEKEDLGSDYESESFDSETDSDKKRRARHIAAKKKSKSKGKGRSKTVRKPPPKPAKPAKRKRRRTAVRYDDRTEEKSEGSPDSDSDISIVQTVELVLFSFPKKIKKQSYAVKKMVPVLKSYPRLSRSIGEKILGEIPYFHDVTGRTGGYHPHEEQHYINAIRLCRKYQHNTRFRMRLHSYAKPFMLKIAFVVYWARGGRSERRTNGVTSMPSLIFVCLSVFAFVFSDLCAEQILIQLSHDSTELCDFNLIHDLPCIIYEHHL
jgi:hypothetical protein